VSTMIPPPEPARHGIAESLALIDHLRRLAFDGSLSPDDALRRVRDAFNAHDQEGTS
jgi:hypothetical protein